MIWVLIEVVTGVAMVVGGKRKSDGVVLGIRLGFHESDDYL